MLLHYTLHSIGPVACGCLQCNTAEIGLDPPSPEKERKYTDKETYFWKVILSTCRYGLVIVQKQHRDVNGQEHYPTTEWWMREKRNKKTTPDMLHIPQACGSLLVFLFPHRSLVGQSCHVFTPLPCFSTFYWSGSIRSKFCKTLSP